MTARIWPCVELQWEWLGGLPPLRKAAVIGAGSMGTGVATCSRAPGSTCSSAAAAPSRPRDARAARNDRYLPQIELPDGVTSSVSDIELAGVDLVVFAVPSGALPAAVGGVGARIPERAAVLVLSKGLVPPFGTLPSEFVGARVHSRAIACLGGPFHSGEAVARGASAVLATTDATSASSSATPSSAPASTWSAPTTWSASSSRAPPRTPPRSPPPRPPPAAG